MAEVPAPTEGDSERVEFSDASLVSLVGDACSGDSEGMARLLGASVPTATGVIRSMLGASADVPDVVQEALLRVVRDVHRLEHPRAYPAWLRQVARNQVRMARRRRGRRPADFAMESGAEIADFGAVAARQETEVLERERWAALEHALGELSAPDRELLVAHYLEGVRLRPLAERLGVAEPTVRKRLSRARGRLRDEMVALLDDGDRERRWTAAAMAAADPGRAALWIAPWQVLGGMAMGTAGVVLGFWLHWRRAREVDERTSLLRILWVNLAAATAFPLALGAGGKAWLVTALALFMATMTWSNLAWLPSVVAPRWALERLERSDAMRRQQWTLWSSRAGLVLGSGLGLLAILLADRPWW